MKCVECHATLKEGIKLKNPRGKYLCRNCFGKLNPSRSRVWCVVGHYIAKSKAKVMSSLTGRSFYVCRPHYQEFASKWRNPDGLYEAFHGTQPTRRRVEVAIPDKSKPLTAVGKIEEIVYCPYGNSQLRGRHYSHKFGDTGDKMLKGRPILATQGKHFFFVDEPKALHFSSRGIIG